MRASGRTLIGSAAAQEILSFASGPGFGEAPFHVDLTVNDDDATAIGAAEILAHRIKVRSSVHAEMVKGDS